MDCGVDDYIWEHLSFNVHSMGFIISLAISENTGKRRQKFSRS